jgi:hypothetical protein
MASSKVPSPASTTQGSAALHAAHRGRPPLATGTRFRFAHDGHVAMPVGLLAAMRTSSLPGRHLPVACPARRTSSVPW